MTFPELQGIDLYHVTSAPFAAPDFATARAKLAHEDTQPKGILGFWLSTQPTQCKGFGDWVARIDLADGAKPIGMNVESLVRFHNATDGTESQDDRLCRYETLRERLREHGDVLFIVDARPIVGEVVVLNPAVVKPLDFQKNDWATETRDRRTPIPDAWFESANFLHGNAVVDAMLKQERAAKAQAFIDASQVQAQGLHP